MQHFLSISRCNEIADKQQKTLEPKTQGFFVL
jgi:hypothetical protein